MADVDLVSEIWLNEHIVVRRGALADAQLVMLPTNASGTPGPLNSQILSQLDLTPKEMPRPADLEGGYFLKRHASGLLCFIVTISSFGATDRTLRANLTAALKDPALKEIGSIWVPLMGTGAGGLSFDRSLTVTINALKASKHAVQSNIRIVISLPPELTDQQMTSLNKAVAAAQRAFSKDSDAGPDIPQETVARAGKPRSASMAMSPALQTLLKLADGFKSLRRQTGGELTTTLLLFALAETRSIKAPPDVREDRSLTFIASAIHDRAGEQFKTAWRIYFATDRDPMSFPLAPTISKFTVNVRNIFKEAEKRASAAGRKIVETDDFIEALLGQQEGRFNESLTKFGTTRTELLEDYRDMRAGEILMALHNDVASVTDKLGYESYADAIARFLVDTDTPPPLSVSIQAPWGAGKSSLMQLIREKLDPKEGREAAKIKFGASAVERLRLDGVLKFLNRATSVTFWQFIGGAKMGEPVETPAPTVKLANPDQRLTIWFNAWKYETSEQIWAGLVDAIVTQVSERLSLIERETFLLRLQLSRIDDGIVRKKIYDRVLTAWWATVQRWVLIGGSAILCFLGLAAPHTLALVPPSGLATALSGLAGFGVTGAFVIQLVLAAYLARQYFISAAKTKAEPATFALADYIRVPDYDSAVGQIHHIHADLKRVLGVTPTRPVKKSDLAPPAEEPATPAPVAVETHDPIIIFIDDLDRCSPGKIAAVVEGVSMLLASDTYRCMFVIGMDPQMVAAALEKAHEDVRNELPSYERTVPLGWRFMDKFVQLPFTIPPSRRDRLDDYLESLGGTPRLKPTVAPDEITQESESAKAAADETSVHGQAAVQALINATTAPKTAPDQPSSAKVTAALPSTEARDVGKIIRRVAVYTAGNPREVKRMVNLARLYLHLRNARRKEKPAWRSPNLDQYARWIALTLRWPDMMRWLQWGIDEATWQSEDVDQELIVRRLLRLEHIVTRATDITAWRAAIGTELHLTDTDKIDWTGDPKLFEFFQAESKRGTTERISEAARLEFW